MKKNYLVFGLMLLLLTHANAQSPDLMNYQAVVRNSGGQPILNDTVSLRFTIHDSAVNGVTRFQEVQHLATNQFGLVNAAIGVVSGNLGTINWGNGTKFLQVEIDPANGLNFTDMGTTQLLSVPYALYAANSAPGPQGPTGPQGLPGSNGLPGATGVQGPSGNDGAIGPQGATGIQGPMGITGATGPQGDTGVIGLQGPIGPTGGQGISGDTGITGPTGAQGIIGATGPQGPNGADGQPGVTGSQGATGAQGATGPSGSDASIPSGVIVMWSGALANIPVGWALCDGTNGTPNLLSRFIVSVPDNLTNPGASGGADSIVLSVAQLPAHTHTGSGTTSTDGAHSHTVSGYELTTPGTQIPFYNWANSTMANNNNNTSTAGAHSHTFSFTTSATGSGDMVDIRPMYFTLAYIMKL
jgi:microcystin-dependent protein